MSWVLEMAIWLGGSVLAAFAVIGVLCYFHLD